MQVNKPYTESDKTTLYNGSIEIAATPYAKVKFGKYNAIGPGCQFVSINHDYVFPGLQYTMYIKMFGDAHPGVKLKTKKHNPGGIEVGSGCWFGNGVFVCGGVKIGNGTVIGAHSVVTKNTRPHSIMVGNPAKEIKRRYTDEMVVFLESDEGRWYDWSEEKIKKNKKFFYTDLTTITVPQLMKIIID